MLSQNVSLTSKVFNNLIFINTKNRLVYLDMMIKKIIIIIKKVRRMKEKMFHLKKSYVIVMLNRYVERKKGKKYIYIYIYIEDSTR